MIDRNDAALLEAWSAGGSEEAFAALARRYGGLLYHAAMRRTGRDDLADRVKSQRNHGSTGLAPGDDPSRPYTMSTFNRLGFNLRLSDIQASVGIAQMSKLDGLLAERLRLAQRYHEEEILTRSFRDA